jgi:hypothetical protein
MWACMHACIEIYHSLFSFRDKSKQSRHERVHRRAKEALKLSSECLIYGELLVSIIVICPLYTYHFTLPTGQSPAPLRVLPMCSKNEKVSIPFHPPSHPSIRFIHPSPDPGAIKIRF